MNIQDLFPEEEKLPVSVVKQLNAVCEKLTVSDLSNLVKCLTFDNNLISKHIQLLIKIRKMDN